MFTAAAALLLAAAGTTHAAAATNALWFPVGIEYQYRVSWGVLPAGRIRIGSSWIEEHGRRLLRLWASFRSNAAVSLVYPVDDFSESIVDPDTFLPLRHYQRFHEGRRHREYDVVFDHGEGLAAWSCRGEDRSGRAPILSDTRDALTAAYYLLAHQGKIQAETRRFVYYGRRLYPLTLRRLREEPVRTRPTGRVRCAVIEPRTGFGTVFVKRGRMLLWMDFDPRAEAPCPRMSASMPIADLHAVLVRAQPVRDSGPPTHAGTEPRSG